MTKRFDEIKNISVIGSGAMGPGISLVFAQKHYNVTLFDIRSEALATAQSIISKNLDSLAENDWINRAEIHGIQEHITYATDLVQAASNADFVVECITEDREAKTALYLQLDKLCPEKTIICSNTSYLNIFEMMPESRQDKTLITHWFAPPHIIPLIEVLPGPERNEDTVQLVMELLRGLGKTPVLLDKYIPGFIINRIQRILGREIFFLLDNGYITADQLDLAVKASIAPRMMLLGLVQRYDFTGLDLSAKNLENPDYIEPPLDNHPKSLFEKVENGDLGVKTGKGFYDYSGREFEDILKERDDGLLSIFKSVASFIK